MIAKDFLYVILLHRTFANRLAEIYERLMFSATCEEHVLMIIISCPALTLKKQTTHVGW